MEDLGPYEIDYVFNLTIKMKYFCFKKVVLSSNNQNSFEIKSPETVRFFLPSISIEAETDVSVT